MSNKSFASDLAKDLDQALTRLQNSYNKKPPISNKPQTSKPTSAVDQPTTGDPAPTISVNGKPPQVEVAKTEKKETPPTVVFDSDLKNKVLSLLVTNKMQIKEVNDNEIVFEFENNTLTISPK